jgi:adenylate cyclase class 2
VTSAGAHREIEVKLRVRSAAAARRLLRRTGFGVVRRRVFETNVLLDNPARDLLAGRSLLRVRRSGGQSLLTYKGAPASGRHKSREELETPVGRPDELEAILGRLGFAPVFRYEKFRTEYRRGRQPGLVTLDETPIGVFLELEGAPAWIDAAARALGFTERDYILASYAALYCEHCRDRGTEPGNMLFSPGRSR